MQKSTSSKASKPNELNLSIKDPDNDIVNHPYYFMFDPSPKAKDYYFTKKNLWHFFSFVDDVLVPYNNSMPRVCLCTRCWNFVRTTSAEMALYNSSREKLPGLNVMEGLLQFCGSPVYMPILRLNQLEEYLLNAYNHRDEIKLWTIKSIASKTKAGIVEEVDRYALRIPKFLAGSENNHNTCKTLQNNRDKTIVHRDDADESEAPKVSVRLQQAQGGRQSQQDLHRRHRRAR